MIPKILWQTYKTKYPPEISLKAIRSWLIHNSDLQWYYMDDEKCEQFIKDHFSDEFYTMYNSLPFGVMKADVWRVAVVYVYGGIYADLDTECLKSSSSWVKPDYNLIVGVETKCGRINNFVFAAAPKHPALLNVLHTFLQIYNSPSFLNKNSPTPIQDFGANSWSIGILNHYNLQDQMNLGAKYYNENDKVKEEKVYFYDYESEIFSSFPSANTAVFHTTGSVMWNNNQYDSWRKEQFEVFGVFS